MKTLLLKIFRNLSGATAVEYGLLISLIGLAATFGMKNFSDALYNLYVTVDRRTDLRTNKD
ncbi:Flp family type IVb pilin [Novosphingobium sp. CCH12-A3]|uniref:Flp family type IVb pilin n=1 Tax=Novosphingobium sp. CCH12-A3 TaxID=1768752 RepID=UPI000B17F92E|nr:Flp family type IVb pilin [Novosphingobium sp. CCH12-A3]